MEGLAGGGPLTPLQQAFHENHALQCGYCTPGIAMAARGLPVANPDAAEQDIRVRRARGRGSGQEDEDRRLTAEKTVVGNP